MYAMSPSHRRRVRLVSPRPPTPAGAAGRKQCTTQLRIYPRIATLGPRLLPLLPLPLLPLLSPETSKNVLVLPACTLAPTHMYAMSPSHTQASGAAGITPSTHTRWGRKS